MSEAMTNREIEDVLSSIRRLVSEDLRPSVLPAAKPAPQPAAAPSAPGLSIEELDELLRAMNDISLDLRTTLGEIFAARLDEKKKR